LWEIPLANNGFATPRRRGRDERTEKYRDEKPWRVSNALTPEGDLSGLADWAGKLAGTLARIGALFHLADHVGQEIPCLGF
jgi:hypothetical protein